jgi:hypothetical protein
MFIEMKRIAIVLCISVWLLSCTEKSSQSASDYSDSLIILKNASEVQYFKPYGQDQISYKIFIKYPAQDTIDELNKRIEAKGWKPLKIDWLNPDIPTSNVRGWGSYIDGTTNPELEVHTWNSDWTNEKEDILTYALSYSYPRNDKPNMEELSVIGLYIPGKLAKKALKHIKEYKKSINNKKDL